MKVLGTKSFGIWIGFILLIPMIAMTFIGAFTIGEQAVLMILPVLLLAGAELYLGYIAIAVPKNIVLLDRNSQELVIYSTKKNSTRVALSDIVHVSLNRGSKGSLTGITLKLSNGHCVCIKNLSSYDKVLNTVMNYKNNPDDYDSGENGEYEDGMYL